jgi:hypothetical protein
MLGEFSPVLKSILLPLLLLEKGLVWAARGVMQAADFITGGLFSAMEDEYDLIVSANDGRREEEERIRALNEEYTKLSDALKEQQEYYMQQRRHLNAEHEIETYTVNDAIITPKGVVHTNPNDFIIATRTPETLGAGNGGDVYINIINNTSSEITTQQKTMGGGAKEITIMVDKIVQNGIATGKYDMAFGAQAARNRGKSIMA